MFLGGSCNSINPEGPQVPLLKSAGLRTLNEGSGHRPDGQAVAAILPSPKMLSVFQHLLNPPIAIGEAVPQPEPRREEDHDGLPKPDRLPEALPGKM